MLLYLQDKANSLRKMGIGEQMRVYNALNWPSYNDKTRKLVTEKLCYIVVGTTTIAVGVDLDTIHTVVIFGDPRT
jgi:hypothetical protein